MCYKKLKTSRHFVEFHPHPLKVSHIFEWPLSTITHFQQPSLISRVAISPLRRPNQLNLAFLKLFATNKMVWPFCNFLVFFECIYFIWPNLAFLISVPGNPDSFFSHQIRFFYSFWRWKNIFWQIWKYL